MHTNLVYAKPSRHTNRMVYMLAWKNHLSISSLVFHLANHASERRNVNNSRQARLFSLCRCYACILLVSRKMLIVSVGGYDVCKWFRLTREGKKVVISDMGINMGSHSPRILGSY